MNEQIFDTNNYENTQEVGEKVAGKLEGGEVIALYGELGSGKTTFIQGLAKGLGIKRRIISPTFIIIRTYKIKFGNFYHIDLYRIGNEKDIEALGIQEIINNPKNIIAIEWAEKIGKLLPKKRIDIEFEYLGDDKRKISINSKL